MLTLITAVLSSVIDEFEPEILYLFVAMCDMVMLDILSNISKQKK